MTVFFKVRRGVRKNIGYNKGYDTAKKKEYRPWRFNNGKGIVIENYSPPEKERDTQVVLHRYITCVRVLKSFSQSPYDP